MPWRKENNTHENNRINVILAIIFLLAGLVLFKLYNLQVSNYDLYVAKASGQQDFSSVLQPERGRIFIKDSSAGGAAGGDLFPLATNKDFALLYAIPKDMQDPEKIANVLYTVFDEAKVKKDVDDMLKQEDKSDLQYELDRLKDLPDSVRKVKEAEVKANFAKNQQSPDFIATRQARIEAEIANKKKSIIIDYTNIFNKKDLLYYLLEQRVGDNDLKTVYAGIASSSEQAITPDELEMKNNKIYMQANGSELAIPGLGYIMKTYRYYPENNIGANLLGFVSYAGDTPKGQYGLEGFFNDELTGKPGFVQTDKSAGGDLIIVDDRKYTKPQNGSDLILTIDRTIEFTVCQKLDEAVLKHGADSGSVIIMNPKTGAVIAMCSSPDFDPNNYQDVKNLKIYNNEAVFSQYEPGSIFKALTMSMALDQGKLTPATTYDDTGEVKIDKYTIKNSENRAMGVVDMNTVLEQSLNTGAIFAMRKIGPDMFYEYVQNYGFGEKTGIELEGEAAGDISSLAQNKFNREIYAATASFGQGIAVTPLQMIDAFGVIANGGILMKPYIVKEIVHSDGTRTETQPQEIRRVISERAAMLTGGMLVNVVDKGLGKRAAVPGYYVGGKTGTAQVPLKNGRGYDPNSNIGSFAGFAPVDNPAFVMLVRIDHPRDVAWAESTATPLWGDIAKFLLNYWQIPTERPTADSH